jgi:8-oxo-dGTP diphosphatase
MAARFAVHPRTLVFLLNGDDVLLIKRAQEARLFPGLYNGIGGHVERGEDVLSSARREVREETGLEVERLSLRGVLTIAHSQYRDGGSSEDGPGALVFMFVGHTDRRHTRRSDEGEPVWVPLQRLREVNLVPDLYDLLPRLLSRPADEDPIFVAA